MVVNHKSILLQRTGGSRKWSEIFSRTRQENIILPFWILQRAVLTDLLSLVLRLIERSNSPIYFANTWPLRSKGIATCSRYANCFLRQDAFA